jgi:CheY-like chemotaxis protein
VVFEQPAEITTSGVSVAIASGLIRVLVADDHRMVREGLVMILESQPDISVVGQANDGREALELTRKLAVLRAILPLVVFDPPIQRPCLCLHHFRRAHASARRAKLAPLFVGPRRQRPSNTLLQPKAPHLVKSPPALLRLWRKMGGE